MAKRKRGRESSVHPPETPRPAAARTTQPTRVRPWVHLAIAALLVTATCLLYARDVDLGFFTLDDSTYVVDNPWIRGFTASNVTHVLTAPYFTMYAPSHLLSYTADHAVGGLDPRTYHRSSNLWAALAAVLVYAAGVALTGDALAAALAALLFVAAPVHVEAIAWISSRKDLVSTVFALLALVAHVRLRRGRPGARAGAYAVAVLAFAIAVGAKQSVAVLPLVLLAYDLVVERRRLVTVLADKIPYAVLAALVTYPTLGALPSTRSSPSVRELVASLAANLWLLTGLGTHVLFRDPETGVLALVAGLLIALAALPVVVPLPVVRRLPSLDRFLFAWLLLALLPSLATAFAARGGPGLHPVTDRYLFFASAPFAILVASRATALGRRQGPRGVAASTVALLALAALWSMRTLAYLDEWRDPRSVWHAATRKSNDVDVHLYLATHLEDAADRMDAAKTLPPDLVRLADALSPGAGRGAAITREWQDGARGGDETRKLRAELRKTAWDELEKADSVRGARVLPNLYFRRGKLLLEDHELERARAEFEQSYEQSQMHTWEETRKNYAVQCHYALGIIAWQAKDYPEALRWLRLAEDEQTRFGGNWVPDLARQRARLEVILGGASAPPSP